MSPTMPPTTTVPLTHHRSRPDARTRVACGASSYHGPASTSPGGATPLGAVAKGLTHPARYPVPSPFFRRRGEEDAEFHGRMFKAFKNYLDTYEHEVRHHS